MKLAGANSQTYKQINIWANFQNMLVRNCKHSWATINFEVQRSLQGVNSYSNTPTSFEFTSTVVCSFTTVHVRIVVLEAEHFQLGRISRAKWTDSQETSIVLKAIDWFWFCKATLDFFNYSIESNPGPKIILNSLSSVALHQSRHFEKIRENNLYWHLRQMYYAPNNIS